MITIEDVKIYLGIDYADEGINKRLEHLIKLAKSDKSVKRFFGTVLRYNKVIKDGKVTFI